MADRRVQRPLLIVNLTREARAGVDGYGYDSWCDGSWCAGWVAGNAREGLIAAVRVVREHANRVSEVKRKKRGPNPA